MESRFLLIGGEISSSSNSSDLLSSAAGKDEEEEKEEEKERGRVGGGIIIQQVRDDRQTIATSLTSFTVGELSHCFIAAYALRIAAIAIKTLAAHWLQYFHVKTGN